jgi:hypothetical protein
MSAPTDLAECLASKVQQRATNAQMPSLGLSVGLTIPPYEEGVTFDFTLPVRMDESHDRRA